MESNPAAVRRSPSKSKRSTAQAPRQQTDVVLSTSAPSTSASKRKTVSGEAVDKGSNRGQRTGGKPDKKGRTILAKFSEETAQTSRRAFMIEESSNEGGSSHTREY